VVPWGAAPSSNCTAVVPWKSLRLVAWCLVMEEISSGDEKEIKKPGGRLLKKSCGRENVWPR
jgi:hypothetical protein